MKLPIFLGLVVSTAMLQAAPPVWWPNNGVQQSPSLNYGPANLGQLKNMAKKAKQHMDATLVGGAGFSVNAMVASLGPDNGVSYTPAELAANYGPVNLGQVKAVAKPFYDRLIAAGFDTKANFATRSFPNGWAFRYPWNPSTPSSTNYGPANIGQLKAVFAFDLSGFDTNQDGIGDGWFAQYFTGVTGNTGPNDDYDGDGLTNLEESRRLLNPKDSDTDYDGRSDSMEIADGTDPTDASSVQPVRLAYWRMNDASFAGEEGELPLTSSNNALTTGRLGQALDGTVSNSLLVYKDVETNGKPNINLKKGSVRFWIKPSVTSGSDLQSWGRVLEFGTWTPDASIGTWAVYFNPDATKLLLWSQDQLGNNGGGLESASLGWNAGEWHQVVITYGPTAMKIYIDGSLSGSAGAFTVYPSAAVRNLGFSVSTDRGGGQRSKCVVDELETFNYELTLSDVQAGYTPFAGNQDTDGDNLPDAWEISKAGNLTALNGNGTADADGDGFSDLMEYQTGSDPTSNDLNNTAKTETLGYDNANRLRTVTGKSILSYTPDANGNLTQTTP